MSTTSPSSCSSLCHGPIFQFINLKFVLKEQVDKVAKRKQHSTVCLSTFGYTIVTHRTDGITSLLRSGDNSTNDKERGMQRVVPNASVAEVVGGRLQPPIRRTTWCFFCHIYMFCYFCIYVVYIFVDIAYNTVCLYTCTSQGGCTVWCSASWNGDIWTDSSRSLTLKCSCSGARASRDSRAFKNRK